MAESKSKSESTVAARERLNEQTDPGGTTATLEQQATDQERQQAQELNSSLSGSGNLAAQKLQEKASDVPAAPRAGHEADAPTRGGFMDQLSRRNGGDALEGHFVSIDLSDKGVKQAYEQVGLQDHTGSYGVYLEPLSLDPDTGIPQTALVRLRDETNARVQVPYEALSPAESGGR
jgi:hypothetical protein